MSYTKQNFFKWNFGLNVMDITIAVIIGVIVHVYTHYTPIILIEPYLLTLGPWGWVVFYTYEGIYYVLYMMGGWLRKKAGVIILAGLVCGVVGYAYSPEGFVLPFILVMGGIFSGTFLHFMNWKKDFLTAWLAGGLYFLGGETTFFAMTGFWPSPALNLLGVYILGFTSNGIITGYVSRLLANALSKTGITEVILEEKKENMKQ